MIGYVQYKEYRYAVLINAGFSGWRMYLKPYNCESALFAECLSEEKFPSIADSFSEDWYHARYRLDVEKGVSFNTTMANKTLAGSIAVAMLAANTLTMAEHSRQSHGEFESIWTASTDNPNLKAVFTNSLGILAAGWVQTPELTIVFATDDNKAKIMPQGVELTYDNQMNIVKDEAARSPLFNSLNKDAKRMFTLVNHYIERVTNEEELAELKQLKPKRSGYSSVTLSNKLSYAGSEYLKSTVTKSAVNMGVYQTIEDVREAHPDKNTAWIEQCNYKMITDDILDDIMKELWEAPIISFDTETTGLKINFYSREGLADELVGVCISPKPGTGYYFPLQHKLFANLCNGDHRYFMQTYMKKLLEEKPIVCHNLSYDWKVAYIYDINVNCVFDTMLAFGVTQRYERTDCPLGLKAICSRLFSIDMFEIEDFVIAEWKNTDITFADLPYDLVAHYGPADADITLRVYYWCMEHNLLDSYGARRVFDLETNFSKVVSYSEFWGYHIDIDKIPQLEEEIISGMEREKAELFRIVGREFNPNSSVQLSKIIFQELYPDILAQGIVAKASTAKETLWELDELKTLDGEPRYPLVSHLLAYRKYEGTYKNFLKKKDQFITAEGFVFPKVQQLGTNTGRLSIHEPNYQSYNDVVKKHVTGRSGYYIYDCDFAQIEYRVLASMAGQDALIKAFDDPDLDYHTHQAARMFSLPYAAVTKQLRQQSKGINFGLPYGMGDESLGKRVFGARTPENTRKAADLRRRFFDGQDNILQFFERVRAQGVNSGYTETWLGRRRYYHKDQFSVASIRRQAGNHVIQGTAADIWKMAVTRFFNRVVKEGWLGKVLFDGFIHDELMGEVSIELDPYEFIKAWREEYELVIDKFCRLYAGFGWGRSWYEAKKADYPPYFIDSLCNKAGQGIPWSGDYTKLILDTKKDMYDYETKRVSDWLLSVDKGTILAPHIGGYLYDKVSDWWDDIKAEHPEFEGYVLKFNKKNPDAPVMKLEDVIRVFCAHENIEYKPNWIVSPDDKSASTNNSGTAPAGSVDEPDDEDTAAAEQAHNQLVCEQVYQMGFYLDIPFNILYLRYDNDKDIEDFAGLFGKPMSTGDLQVRALSFSAQGVATCFPTTFDVELVDFNAIQEFIRVRFARKV